MAKFEEKLKETTDWCDVPEIQGAILPLCPGLPVVPKGKFFRHDVFATRADAREFVERELESRDIDYEVWDINGEATDIRWHSEQDNGRCVNVFHHEEGQVPVLTPVGV